MRVADRIVGRTHRSAQTLPPAGAPTVSPVAEPTSQVRPAAPATDLRRRRDSLARRFADLQWDLGGIAYEMASRDHFRLDVLVKQAAKLQEVDAELAGIERMLRLDEAGAAGSCPSCGALYSRGAGFCWSCGTTLIEPAPPTNGTTAPGSNS